MGFYKKTILLTNKQNYDKGIMVLTFEKNNSGVFGNIKSYDFDANNMVLGISVNGEKIVKQNIIFANGNEFTFKLDNAFNIDAKLGCVLCSKVGNEYVPKLWGANGERAEFKQDVINLLERQDNNQSNFSTNESNVSMDFSTMQSTMRNAEKPNSVAVVSECAGAENGEKKETDNLDKSALFESSESEIEDAIDNELNKEINDQPNFFELVGDQIDELFAKFPVDENLAKLIPNSKWVRVDYDGTGRDYIIGLIYENEVLKYICYGVPGRYDTEPPTELKKFSQWLPLDPGNPDDGFWVMFQDAFTGDSVEIDNMAL